MSHRAPVALENGRELREWVEREAWAAAPTVIRCATFTATLPGLRWLRRLSRTCKDIRVLCDTHQAGGELAALAATILGEDAAVRVMPARPGATVADDGLFHAKLVILDSSSAVVGSANFTGRALAIGPGPSNVEVAVGLSGPVANEAIAQLVDCFDQWWERAAVPASPPRNEPENETMTDPEYVVFSERLHWGIAQVQTDSGTEGALFGPPRWLAIADIPSGGPEGTGSTIAGPERTDCGRQTASMVAACSATWGRVAASTHERSFSATCRVLATGGKSARTARQPACARDAASDEPR